jgi:hypothetical protein
MKRGLPLAVHRVSERDMRPTFLTTPERYMGPVMIVTHVHGAAAVGGAVTQPRLSTVVFRGLAPEEFRAFREPGYVKIV